MHELERGGDMSYVKIAMSLRELGILHGKFEARISWIENSDGWFELDGKKIGCTADGCNEVRFYISTNKGEEPKTLAGMETRGVMIQVIVDLKHILQR